MNINIVDVLISKVTERLLIDLERTANQFEINSDNDVNNPLAVARTNIKNIELQKQVFRIEFLLVILRRICK